MQEIVKAVTRLATPGVTVWRQSIPLYVFLTFSSDNPPFPGLLQSIFHRFRSHLWRDQRHSCHPLRQYCRSSKTGISTRETKLSNYKFTGNPPDDPPTLRLYWKIIRALFNDVCYLKKSENCQILVIYTLRTVPEWFGEYKSDPWSFCWPSGSFSTSDWVKKPRPLPLGCTYLTTNHFSPNSDDYLQTYGYLFVLFF